MKKKVPKVAETATPYPAKKPATAAIASKSEPAGVRYVNDAAFKKAAAKVFKTHSELFRKLAQ